jgi:hypothetical protein
MELIGVGKLSKSWQCFPREGEQVVLPISTMPVVASAVLSYTRKVSLPSVLVTF